MFLTIEEMTRASYIMMGLSGLFAVMSIVMFWTLDIKRSWYILYGRKNRKFLEHNAKQLKKIETNKNSINMNSANEDRFEKRAEVEALSNSTVYLNNNLADATMKLPDKADTEKTVLLENKGFVIIQNITYCHDKNS